MNLLLFFIFLISVVYCCDFPVIKGFEVFVNNHDSMLYSIGLSIIAAYIFYFFQVIIPRTMRFRHTRNVCCTKLYEIEQSMLKLFSLLQGKASVSDDSISKELIEKYLEEVDVFTKKSRYEIHNHKELSVFEAISYHDNKIIALADEIVAGQYIEEKYETILFKLKTSKFHAELEFWKSTLPGKYEHFHADTMKELSTGYVGIDLGVVRCGLIASVDEYSSIYKEIKKLREKLYKRII